MIDTVTLKFTTSPTQRQMRYWNVNQTHLPSGQVWKKHYINASLAYLVPISMTYYPPGDLYTAPALFVQLSLPKALFGNNVRLLSDEAEIALSARAANRLLRMKTWAPAIDLRKGILHRVDVTYDHQVGSRVQEYVRALQNLTYPHRRTMPYRHEGVQYYSKQTTTKFYDKAKEDGTGRGKGILRQETTLRHTNHIQEHMGIKDPTLRDITQDWVVETLDEDLRKLRLEETLIATSSLAMKLLVNRYGWIVGARLYSHWAARTTLPYNQIIAYRRIKAGGEISSGDVKRGIQRDERMIAAAGVALTTVDGAVPLPPLRIEGNVQEVVVI